MKVEFSIQIPNRTLTLPYIYPTPLPEYELADTAYLLALRFLTSHPSFTLADIDYTWRVSQG